jgi:hypothetical protein
MNLPRRPGGTSRSPSRSWLRRSHAHLEHEPEPTLHGTERSDQVRNDPVIDTITLQAEYRRAEQHHRHMIRRRALIGLGLVLLAVVLIVGAVILAVGEKWISEGFGRFVAGISVPSMIAAWLYVVKRTF